MYTDSHCHLTMEQFDDDREPALERARAAGVTSLLVVSSYLGDFEKTVAFARTHDAVHATAGVHPHEATGFTDEIEEHLAAALAEPKVVAVGEIGLDYHYDHSPREVQREVFRRQIRLARAHGRPIVIHTREAVEDTIRILESEKASDLGGVFHSFTEDAATAAWAVANNFAVSFSGILTFRTAGALREVARGIPLERILIETDAPFLSPVPLRGKRNEPSFVPHVARCVGELHSVSAEEIGRITSATYRRVFRLEEKTA